MDRPSILTSSPMELLDHRTCCLAAAPVMIDFFNVTFDGDDFGVIGKPVRVRQAEGQVSQSYTDVTVRADTLAPMFKVQIEARASRIRLWGSPLAWLQGHNGMGSNELHPLVARSVALVFAQLHRPVPASIERSLAVRDYRVHELHVAEMHRMPHPQIAKLCDNIRRHAPSDLQAVPLEIGKGIGTRLWPHSRDRCVILYDKHQYFMDGLIKHKKKLLGRLPAGSFERLGPSLDFSRMLDEHLKLGIRIETRHQRNLKRLGLDKGSAWKPDTARTLHHQVLDTVPLADMPALAASESLLAGANQDDRRLLALWLDGRDVRIFFDVAASYYRWRKLALSRFGVDVSRAPIACDDCRWTQLISATSVVDTPAWAIDSSFVFQPGQRNQDQDHHQPFLAERAWLMEAR